MALAALMLLHSGIGPILEAFPYLYGNKKYTSKCFIRVSLFDSTIVRGSQKLNCSCIVLFDFVLATA